MVSLFQVAGVVFASVASPTDGQIKPLHLQIEERDNATIVRVIGAAAKASAVGYDLEVTKGGNKSVQRGVAHLRPGLRATVATVRLGSGGRLSAKLSVRPPAQPEYIEEAARP